MNRLIRRCAQCRVLNHRALMLRVYHAGDGSPVLGAGGGRGLYLCDHVACLQRAAGNKTVLRLLAGIEPERWRSWCEARRARLMGPAASR